MKVTQIGIFGAQGELGRNLCERLSAIKPASIELLPTVNRSHNKEIAQVCDLAVIVVRPNQVENLLKEISPYLKPTAQILSFAAYYPLDSLSRNSGRICMRGMADPWWSISAFFQETSFDVGGLEFIFSGLTKTPSLSLCSDREIDAFTVHMCQLFVTLFLSQTHEVNAAPHLRYLMTHLHTPVEELRVLLPQGNPAELLATLSTKGGISELIAKLIRSNPTIAPNEVFKEVAKSFSNRF